MIAKIIEVQEKLIFTELALAAADDDTTITVEDIYKMNQDGGSVILQDSLGDLHVFRTDYTVDGAPDDTTDEIDDDDDGPPDPVGTLTLADPLTDGPWDDDTMVIPQPPVYTKKVSLAVESQEDVLVCEGRDGVYDRIPSGTRDEASAETVLVEFIEGEWQVTDLVGTQGTGLTRGYDTNPGDTDCSSGTESDPIALCEVPVTIPTSQHRVLIWYSANLRADDGIDMRLGIDDKGFDFNPGDFPLVKYTGDTDPTVSFFTPFIPEHTFVGPDPDNILGHDFRNYTINYRPTTFMLYTDVAPTPGLHYFRLTGWNVTGSGSVMARNPKLWVTVI